MSFSSHVPRYVSPVDDNSRNSSVGHSVKSSLKTVAHKYKEHRSASQTAFEAYYGVSQAAPAPYKPATTRNNSSASEDSVNHGSSPSSFKKAIKAVKKHAKEHHASVNLAYANYYGDSRVLANQEVKHYSY
ncbi:hypothetical protein EJ08DRAFT_5523 [Tothia fuscella]|uniref:Uncharacterized protein n=1 Tax=Tothia fuscella TaxID=1048955 RepID=A0A9P4U4E1_9PEZI|nr:hypothetical protein EJ08DRAFT_5523 [Tothia fuscella]